MGSLRYRGVWLGDGDGNSVDDGLLSSLRLRPGSEMLTFEELDELSGSHTEYTK